SFPIKQMAKLDDVLVYYINQDETLEQPCRVMTRQEARLAKKAGDGWFICHGKAFRLCMKMPVVMIREQDRQRPTVNSCCGISKNEMLANAEVADSKLAIIKAQQKVKAYPHTYDKQAVLARGYWNYQQAL